MTSIPEQEIARRLPVWTALTELFVDSELKEFQQRYLVDVLRESGYSLSDLHRILVDEVAPVFESRLGTAADAWQPWDADFVRDKMLAYLERQPTLSERMMPAKWLQRCRAARLEKKFRLLQKLLTAQ